MMIASRPTMRPIASAIAALTISLLASGPLRAQPADHGVQAWQAERLIKDFANNFAAQHPAMEQGSKVRIKISEIRRVYNKDVGWIVVAIFEGAVIPYSNDAKASQPFYNGILKIAADRSGQVQEPVVNEGQGLTEISQLTSILRRDLPEQLGSWANWGGNPADIAKVEEPPEPISPNPTPGPIIPPQPNLGPQDNRNQHQREVMNEYTTAHKLYYDALKAGNGKAAKDVSDRFYAAEAAYKKLTGGQ